MKTGFLDVDVVVPLTAEISGLLMASAIIGYYDEARRRLEQPENPEELRRVVILAVVTGRAFTEYLMRVGKGERK